MLLSLYFRLGEDEGSMLVSWPTLNPMKLVKAMTAFAEFWDFKSFEENMKRVSALSGKNIVLYQN
jgi:hypothetical protein